MISRPNILFAFADDWGRHAGGYGTDWLKTPTFDRLAEAGILFDQAYTAVAKCAPCRASVLTGRYPWQNEEVGNHLAYWPKEKFQTYIETLENTLIIMSSDHGMPFPRAKGDTYMAGNHVPLSVMWKGRLKKPGRTCAAYVNFVDIAPTILELAGVDSQTSAMAPVEGRSWTEIFRGDDLKGTIPERSFALYGRERHDLNIRPENRGYPSRAIRQGKYLHINNLAPDLPPTALKESGGIAQFKKLDENSTGYQLLYGMRPADEFYHVEEDPESVRNLASNPEYSGLMKSMRSMLNNQLRKQKDPRMTGGEVLFDTYPATVPWQTIHKARVEWEKKNSKN